MAGESRSRDDIRERVLKLLEAEYRIAAIRKDYSVSLVASQGGDQVVVTASSFSRGDLSRILSVLQDVGLPPVDYRIYLDEKGRLALSVLLEPWERGE